MTASEYSRSYLYVFIGVFLAHALFLWWAAMGTMSPPKQKTPSKLLVKSVQLQPRPLTPPMPIAQNEPVHEVLQPAPLPQKETVPVKPTPPQEPPKKPVEEKKNPPPAPKPVPKTKPAEKPKQPEKPKPKPTEQKKPTPKPQDKTPEPKKPTPKPQEKLKSPEKPTPPKPTAQEIAAQEAAIAAKAAAQAKQRELLSQASASLSKVGETREKIGSTKTSDLSSTLLPQTISSLQIDALPSMEGSGGELSAKEITYRDEVAYRLKAFLKLPENGQVKIKLTLDRSGKVASVTIINSESTKNRQYVEKTLPTTSFPPFGNRFGQVQQYSFMITLKNDR